MSELAFPPIIEPASAPTPVAVVDTKSADLAKLDLTAVALAQYGPWSGEIAAVKANLSTLVLDLSTPSKIKEARTLRARLIGEPLAAARKVSAGIKSKMAQTSKAVGAELEKIEAGYAEADGLILPKIEGAEAEFEREREAKAKIERERIERHRATIARIRAYAVKADTDGGMTATRVAAAIQQIEALPTPTREAFDEFAIEAADAIFWTLERLRITHTRLQRAEQAEAEAAALRDQLAAQQAAQPKEQPRAQEEAQEAHQQDSGDQAAGADRAGGGEQSAVATEKTTTQPAQGGGQVDGCRAPESHLDGCSGPVTQDHTSLPASPITEYTAGQPGQQVLKVEAETPDATDRPAPMTSPSVGSMGAGQAADAAPAGGFVHKTTAVGASHLASLPVVADEKPTLKLGDICDRIAPLKIDAAGLERLGFPAAATDRAAKLYRASDWSRIKAAMIDHLKGLA
jgi:hypothetical protein